MHKFKVACTLLIALSLTGCAQTINYRLKDVQVVSKSPFLQYTLGVKEFQDVREKTATPKMYLFLGGVRAVTRQGTKWFHTSDDAYSGGDVAPLITRMVAKHIATSKLFQRVKVLGTDTIGTDFVLVGKIKRFEAFKDAGPSESTKMAQVAFGLIGSLATMGVQSRYEATTILTELKLIRVSTHTVVWTGEVEGVVAGSDYADPEGYSVYAKVNESLKKAVDDLIQKLGQVDPSLLRS